MDSGSKAILCALGSGPCSWLPFPGCTLFVIHPWVYFKRPMLCIFYHSFKKKRPNFPMLCVHFCLAQAWEVNKRTNCVTTYLADCETQLSQAPRQGLLYGVPVSLKECFSYKVCPALASDLSICPSPPPSPVCVWVTLGLQRGVRSRGLRGYCGYVWPWPVRLGWCGPVLLRDSDSLATSLVAPFLPLGSRFNTGLEPEPRDTSRM